MEQTARMVNNSPGGAEVLLGSVGYLINAVTPNLTPTPFIKALQSFSDHISDARVMLRLFDLIKLASWAKDVEARRMSNSSKETRNLLLIEQLQVFANLCYCPLENMAYLASHGLLSMSKTRENQIWAISCRFWAAHIFLDFIRLYLTQPTPKTSEQERKNWWSDFVINMGWLPLTVHWSLVEGIGLSRAQVGMLGSAACLTSLMKKWRVS